MLEHKLIIPPEIKYAELAHHLQNGAKFRIYSYTISILFAVTLKKLSPAILICADEGTSFQKKYNNLTRIFGWWGIPWGPIYSLKSLKTNNAGGIDVTEDILLNLNEEGWHRRIVKITTVKQVFLKPPSVEHKAFSKSFKSTEYLSNINLFIGLYLNVQDDQEPFYMIGIQSTGDFEACESQVRLLLLKQFRKDVFFHFIDLNLKENQRTGELLKEQGLHYKC